MSPPTSRSPACRGWPARGSTAFPRASRYLRADPDRAACGRRGSIGCCRPATAGSASSGPAGPTHNNDRNRSAALAAFAPLAELPRTALVALQKGPAAAQIGDIFGRAPLLNLGPEIQDFRDTMAMLGMPRPAWYASIPSVGHLAGAHGQAGLDHAAVRAGLALDAEREDTPWYPSLRLFRQSAPRDWEELAGRVARELERAVGAARRATRA